MKIVITGGAGFVAHHVVEHFLKSSDAEIVVLDKLTYASCGYDRLRDIEVFDDKRVKILGCDLTMPISEGMEREIGDVDYILHLAAESHVDRSIQDAYPFIMSNVVGTHHILEFARRQLCLKGMCYFSTDEVFGPADDGVYYKEWDRYRSSNPYAATKAGGEELCIAYQNTHGVPVWVTHTMNVVGERQHWEKFVPRCIIAASKGLHLYIHADPTRTIPGSRCWIHARNVAHALQFLLTRAVPGDKYNIVGEERNNLEIAEFIAHVVGGSPHLHLVDFHSSRPGHDRRYALDGTKLREMGWTEPVGLNESLEKVVRWSLEHKRWLGDFDDRPVHHHPALR